MGSMVRLILVLIVTLGICSTVVAEKGKGKGGDEKREEDDRSGRRDDDDHRGRGKGKREDMAIQPKDEPVADSVNPNHPGLLDPALSAILDRPVRIPHTDQSTDRIRQLLQVGEVVERDAVGAVSLTGRKIVRAESPQDDLRRVLHGIELAALAGQRSKMKFRALRLLSILLGTTKGQIYDGFAMLNYNRGAFVSDHVPGEYKMKVLRDSGLSKSGIDGRPRKVWEVDVNMLWYNEQFDSDTFLLRVPVAAHEFDTLRVNYSIYSLVRDEFAPTTILVDHRLPSSVSFPFKGFDSVWQQIKSDTVTKITVDHPPLRHLRGVYTWGWREHPPRIQFLQPIYEMVNAHTGEVELEPQGKSYAFRNRGLTIEGIGEAAPEKKMYHVAMAIVDGASPTEVLSMLTDPETFPKGTGREWGRLVSDQRQLPPEAWELLAKEGLDRGTFGRYRFVTAFVNNEMYGEGPKGNEIQEWQQGDRFLVKLINLDRHTHYFRNVDFGPPLHDDISNGGKAGSHSFEIMSYKPIYGVPKVAEMQWRAGWGFRPHFDIMQQADVFSRSSDRRRLKSFFDGSGEMHYGYQYSEAARKGDFIFNPPPFIIQSEEDPSPQRLREEDGTEGLVIGQLTEGYGLARMCSHETHPIGEFCEQDVSAFNPHGILNRDTDGDGVNDALWFPPFLRNPNPKGGDIIPPTPAWKPFLWINPSNGTLFIDPDNPSNGYWADLTYAHGAPIPEGASLDAQIESARASGAVFYQFDDLFHDNDIFSPHPQ